MRQVSIELSSLLNNFLKANESSKFVAKVSGKRKREVGLVVQAKVTASDTQKKINTFINQNMFCRPCKRRLDKAIQFKRLIVQTQSR